MAQGNTPQDSEFPDLEKKLANLNPTSPNNGFVRKMGRRLDAMERDREEKKNLWRRFIPVAMTAGVVLTATLFFQAYLEDKAASINARTESAPNPAPSANLPPAPSHVTGDFLPVSSGEFFRGAADGGIIGVEEDGFPLRQFRLEYENQLRFHQPETGTNLEITWPEETFILVPVATD